MSADLSPRTLPRNSTRHAVTRRSTHSRPPQGLVHHPVTSAPIEGFKAVVDLLLATAVFLVSLPILGLGMLAVRLSSPGPVIYTQTRVGRGGRVFTIYKLRTMSHECESLTGPRWCIPGDPRITPVGAILRKLHIDELPQLWNVLRGDMSLIGPRPERPEICSELRQVIAGYDRRHVVKPGITGYAQIHLPPDTSINSVRNKLTYDRFYIMNRGLLLELYILGCTFLKVVGLKKVYQRLPRRPLDD